MAIEGSEAEEHEASRLLGSSAEVDEEALIDAEEREELAQSAVLSIFFSLYVGVFLSALDGTIVATLLSRIASDFNELQSVSWIATGYLISQAAVQPLYGKLSDIFGRKPLLLIANVRHFSYKVVLEKKLMFLFLFDSYRCSLESAQCFAGLLPTSGFLYLRE